MSVDSKSGIKPASKLSRRSYVSRFRSGCRLLMYEMNVGDPPSDGTATSEGRRATCEDAANISREGWGRTVCLNLPCVTKVLLYTKLCSVGSRISVVRSLSFGRLRGGCNFSVSSASFNSILFDISKSESDSHMRSKQDT